MFSGEEGVLRVEGGKKKGKFLIPPTKNINIPISKNEDNFFFRFCIVDQGNPINIYVIYIIVICLNNTEYYDRG
jgi:hypothetical protein